MQTNVIITASEALTLTYSDLNINTEPIDEAILLANYTHFVKVFGKTFADDMIAKKSTSTLSPTEQEFVDLIERAVAHASLANAVYNLHYRVKNGGVSVHVDDYKQTVSGEELSDVKRRYFDTAALWLQQAQQFVEDNLDDLPTYVDDGCLNNDSTLTRDNNLYIPNKNYAKTFKRYKR